MNVAPVIELPRRTATASGKPAADDVISGLIENVVLVLTETASLALQAIELSSLDRER
jgi:hypothetical protein